LRDYDNLLDAAIDEAVEWATPIPKRSEEPVVTSAWESLKATGRNLGVLSFLHQPSMENEEGKHDTTPPMMTNSQQENERAKVVLEMDRFLQRTLCWRAANRVGLAGVSAASKLARSLNLSSSLENWNENERLGVFVLIAAKLDAERKATAAAKDKADAQQQLKLMMEEKSNLKV